MFGPEASLIFSRTMPRKLPHYLRIERRRAGLSQLDIAILLGVKTASKVSRYENGRRLPPLETVLAYEAILGRPIVELFGGRYRRIKEDVKRRAAGLLRSAKSPRGVRFAERKRSIELITSR